MTAAKTISTKLSQTELDALQANMGKSENMSAFLRSMILDFLNKSKNKAAENIEHANTRIKLEQVLNEVGFMNGKFQGIDGQLEVITQILNALVSQSVKK